MPTSELPIFEIQQDLVNAVKNCNDQCRIIIEAPTGSGKSTQVPAILLDANVFDSKAGEILVLQPRRLAARMLARRVAWERNQKVGGEVGYQVRFENATSKQTRIRYITEGILIRRILDDPDLSGVSAIVFDEFHERHFYGDVSLARCLKLQETRRPDLALVVMSATLEIDSLKSYLGDQAQHLSSQGRTFPVDIHYSPIKQRHKDQLWDHAARAIRDYYKKQDSVEGHTLVFMPGTHEIRKTVEVLRRAPWAKSFNICELYGNLSPDKQDSATAPSDTPKIVVATNVAETSITIDDVRLVVDSGLERRSAFDSRRGITTLHIEKISQASADQRAGRAGRTTAGTALRLWSESDHQNRSESTPAEILRMDLAEAVLLLKASGIDQVRDFYWFEAPDPTALDRSIQWLVQIGALDAQETLTQVGLEISKLPVAPRQGRILIEAAERGCLNYLAVVIAAAQSRDFFLRNKTPDRSDYAEPGDSSDYQALVRAWSRAKQGRFDRHYCDQLGVHGGAGRDIDRIAKQIVTISKRMFPNKDQSLEPSSEEIGEILLCGYSDRIAIRNNKSSLACQVVGKRRGQLDKLSIASKHTGPFIAAEIIEVEGKDVQVKLDYCTTIEESLISQQYPNDFRTHDGGSYNTSSRKVESRIETRFRDLVLASKPGGEVPASEAASLLAERVMSGELRLKRWDTKVETQIARINLLAQTFPEYEIPAVDDEAAHLIIEQICEGAFSYKQIKDREVLPHFEEWIPAQHYGILDRLIPERVELKPGKSTRIFYQKDEKPKISVMIQHLFGIERTPSIAENRIPLVIEILAPNQRPIQVTEDLAGFWKGSYAGVRAQLRGRYPKHDWPEPG